MIPKFLRRDGVLPSLGFFLLSGCTDLHDSRALLAQLQGGRCFAQADERKEICERVSPLAWLTRRNHELQCQMDAIFCLKHSEAREVSPELIALFDGGGLDSDGGDGKFLVGGALATLLGGWKEERAIDALIHYLERSEPLQPGPHASLHPEAARENGASTLAVARALGQFGPKADRALSALFSTLASERPQRNGGLSFLAQEKLKATQRSADGEADAQIDEVSFYSEDGAIVVAVGQIAQGNSATRLSADLLARSSQVRCRTRQRLADVYAVNPKALPWLGEILGNQKICSGTP